MIQLDRPQVYNILRRQRWVVHAFDMSSGKGYLTSAVTELVA